MDIGSFLLFRRKQLGLSLSDVSEVIGCTPQAVHRYEKGDVKINLSLVESFCLALNLSLKSFFRMDPNYIEPYQGEKFVAENFCALLRQELSRNPSLTAKITSELSILPVRIEKWANGSSLPSVGEFLALSRVIGYDPVDLYLGQTKKKNIVHHFNWKALSIVVASLLLASVCISVPIALSSQTNKPIDSSASEGPITSLPPKKKKCNVVIQGYDMDDNSLIDSIHYEYQVEQGDTIRRIETNPYYDYVSSYIGDNVFYYENTKIEDDTNIKALFSKKTFTVTFLGYKDEVLAVSKTRYLSSAIAPTNIEDNGDFRFVSWKEDFTCIKGDLVVHSVFSRFRSNLILDFNGGNENGETNKEMLGYTADSFDSLPKPSKKGHRFLGFFDKNGIAFDKNYKLEDETLSLHAEYEALTYQIHFEGMNETQNVVFGSEVTSLPTLSDDNNIILGWKNGEKKITLPFTYEDDFDITLSPMLASDYFSYDLKGEGVEIKSIKKCDDTNIDLSTLGSYPISKIASHALKDNKTIETITLNQSKVELESSCFDSLSSLKSVYFNNVDSSSIFHEGIFNNCPNVTYLRSGTPMKDSLSFLKLKEYGVQGGENFTFEFNSSTKVFPSSWNDDFGVIGQLIMGEGIKDEVTVKSNGCKILHFVPGRVGYSMITLELPDIDQDELRFYGTSLVKIEGEKFGKVKRFVMSDGGVKVSNRTKPLEVEEFDVSHGRIIALRDQLIKADRILLSDKASEGYFAPLNDKLQVEFYGCSSIPDELTSRSPFIDEKNTHVTFHPEKLYNEDDIIEYPVALLTGEW